MPAPTGPERDPPPSEPVTRTAALTAEDFRSLRRWLIVLGVVSLLAAAAAAFAVVKADESESEAADEDRLEAVERSFDRRLAQLDERLERTGNEIDKQETRLRRTGEESDVAQLDRRLRRVENDLTDAVDAAAESGEGLREVERSVAELRREVRRLR